jgi:hypothetical protein
MNSYRLYLAVNGYCTSLEIALEFKSLRLSRVVKSDAPPAFNAEITAW